MKQSKKEALIQRAMELYNSVYRFALSRVKEHEVAQDIAQMTMETAIKNMDTLKDEAALASWVNAIAYSKIQDHFRELKKYREWTVLNTEDQDALSQVEDEEADILQLLTGQEAKNNIAAAVTSLDPLHQTIIIRHVIYGETLAAVAERLQINYHTVKSHYRRGIAALREEFLKREGGEQIDRQKHS